VQSLWETLPAKNLQERVYNGLTNGVQFALMNAAVTGLNWGVNASWTGFKDLVSNPPKLSDIPAGLSTKVLTKAEHDANVAKGIVPDVQPPSSVPQEEVKLLSILQMFLLMQEEQANNNETRR